jgi:putative ABC transport system substrate-binding protein
MNRRDVMTLLGGAAAAWPVVATAQQSAIPVVGVLSSVSPDIDVFRLDAFRHSLAETGYVEGRNVTIEYHWAEGQYDRLSALAVDLTHRNVAMIFTPGSAPAALAAKAATSTIPIIFTLAVDPIAAGLVASLNRPGANVTGVTSMNVEVGPKRLELLHEVVPAATTIALLVNPTNSISAEALSKDARTAAERLGLRLYVVHAATESEFDAVFAKLAEVGAGALMIGPDTFLTSHSEHLASLALRHAIPAIYAQREFAIAGGLMSYGGSITESNRLAGAYAGRILKGERPANLPVQQNTRVELIINLKTARMFGITVPLPLLARAEEVIE